MGDDEVGGALPVQVPMESAGGSVEKIAGSVDLEAEPSHEAAFAGNTTIEEDEATASDTQLDGDTPDAADNDGEGGLSGAKTNREIDPETDPGDERGTPTESGVEPADGVVENDDMYRHVRELALDTINAVSSVVLVQS